jgi:serine/threonine-protein kinase
MLTGQPPFGAMKDFGEMLTKQTTEPPPPINERRRLRRYHPVSPAMEALVMRCLAKRPQDRFQSVGEVSRALLAPAALEEVAELPAPRPPPRMARRPTPPARGSTGKGWIILVIAALAVAAGTVAFLLLGN